MECKKFYLKNNNKLQFIVMIINVKIIQEGNLIMSNVLGVIAEYNPFHNGHFYHLEKSKKDTGSNYSIAVISGNFTQRRILFYN